MALLPSSSRSSSSSSSPSSSSSKRGKYDVFLSFRGEDTRKKFTDHLYRALEQKGISTFRDNEKLKRGTSIAPELLKAIEESRFAVIILSRDYASSKWCLIELTKIIECMEKTGLVVLPVFHYVDPSDVRKHTGTFAEAFDKHKKSSKDNTGNIKTWKAALTKVANLAGWDLKEKYESEVIQEIIGRIGTELDHKFSGVYEALVGIDSRAEKMLGSYLGEGLGGVRFVGICGMGGMGKTTLAREIYRRISSNFEASSFIADVREKTKNQDLVSLQKQLLSEILMEGEINIWDFYGGIDVISRRLRKKKVFIVLDDVDGEQQLGALAGKHDWFGDGSRIILTSRDSHFLKRNGVDYIYTIKGLNGDEALELFSWGAFKKAHLEESYMDLSRDFVNYAKGLPLALKVLGPLLFGKTMDEWKSALNDLKAVVGEKIMPILQISFDGLTNTQKGLFLDIACFFKGENKDCISDILESFGYCPDYNIGVLKDKSLITINYNGILWMHDLLQDMGQEIVCRKSEKPGERSRLWIYEDVIHVLKNNTGTEAVEGIMLKVPIQKMEHLHVDAFSTMKNLRLLKIGNEKFPQDFINGTMQLPKSLSYLSDELRILEWHRYPFKSMPTSFQPNKLFELRMRCSHIKHLWKGIKNLDELRLIDLSDSQNLIEMPDLSGAPKLKHLILQHCIRLSKIHASLGNLKWLIRLDLNGCKRLENLPPINLESLEIFILSGCSRLKKFPKVMGNMSSLSKLYIYDTAIRDLPLSMNLNELRIINLSDSQKLIKMSDLSGAPKLNQLILQRCIRLSKIHASLGNLKWLILLDLNGCKCLESLPAKINLESLKIFILSGCSRLKKFPKVVGNMSSLSELYLNETAIKDLPLSMEHLTGLIKLDLRDCKNLSSLPNVCCCLMSLKILTLSRCSKLNKLPENLGNIKGLEELDLSETAITELPSSFFLLKNLKLLSLRGCEGLSSRVDPTSMLGHSLSNLWSLTELNLSYCKLQAIPDSLGCLPSLEYLNLSHCNLQAIPDSLGCLSSLKYLVLNYCNLQAIPDSLGCLSSLKVLSLSYCNLQAIPDSLGCLSSLIDLYLEGNNFVCLPESTTRLSNMKFLHLCGCTHLRSLPELPSNINVVRAIDCTSLEILPLRLEDGPYPFFNLLNCVKLINNEDYGDLFITALRHHIQFKGDVPIYHTVIPRREIPKWFRHQSVGTSMNLQEPSDKLKGVVVCALFVLRQHHPLHQLPELYPPIFNFHPYDKCTHSFECYVKANGYESQMMFSYGFSEEFGKVESYHLHMYYSPHKFINWKLEDASGIGQIEIRFETKGPGLEVTKCGARWVYEQDIEDLNQTMHGCSSSNSCSITPYEDDLEDSAKNTKTK